MLCQASMENARLAWEVHVIKNKTKQDVLPENKVYNCIEKECLEEIQAKAPWKIA